MGCTMKAITKIFSVLLLACVAGCGDVSDADKKILESDSLRIGLSSDYPPFEFMKDNQIVGFDIDMANFIAKDLNKKLEIVDMDFDGLIPALQTGRIDCIVSGMTATEERKKNVDFSVEYYAPQFAMLYRKDQPLTTLESFSNSVIGVQLGTSMETFLKEKSSQLTNMNIIALKKNTMMVEELKLSRIDGVFMEEAQAKVFGSRYSELGYTLFPANDMGYSIAFAKGSPWKKPVDAAIIKLRDSGELGKLKEKWVSGDK